MNCATQARKLADYIMSLQDSFTPYEVNEGFAYHHIGALYTDIELQAGLSYNSVVKPRVQNILLNYNEYNTVKKFQLLIDNNGLSNIIKWNHHVKLNRFEDLLKFSYSSNIDCCADLKFFLSHDDNQKAFLDLKGFGPKTLDYLLKLLNVDTIAVDRHVYSFVKLADIDTQGYHETKKVVEYAADFLNIPRASIDKGIWEFMSEKKYSKSDLSNQYSIEFPT